MAAAASTAGQDCPPHMTFLLTPGESRRTAPPPSPPPPPPPVCATDELSLVLCRPVLGSTVVYTGPLPGRKGTLEAVLPLLLLLEKEEDEEEDRVAEAAVG